EYCERALVEDVPLLLNGLKQITAKPPIWGFLTLTGVKGAKIHDPHDFDDEFREIDRPMLMLPEFAFQDYEADVDCMLRPVFDLIWNAAGFEGSPNFHQNGKYRR